MKGRWLRREKGGGGMTRLDVLTSCGKAMKATSRSPEKERQIIKHTAVSLGPVTNDTHILGWLLLQSFRLLPPMQSNLAKWHTDLTGPDWGRSSFLQPSQCLCGGR